MKNKELITEVLRIQEMMGINPNQFLLKESIVDELAEFLAKFLSKASDELLALGVRNPDDLKGLIDDFLNPLVPIASKTGLLRQVIDNLGDDAIKSLAKETLDDTTSVIGSSVKNRMDIYLDLYKRGLIKAEDAIIKIQDELTLAMSKSSDEVDKLKQQIKNEAAERARTLFSNANVVADDVVDTIKNMEEALTYIKRDPKWKKLTKEQQAAIENFCKKNAKKTPEEIANDVGPMIDNYVNKNLDKSTKLSFKDKWKTLKKWQKYSIYILVASGIVSMTGVKPLCTAYALLDWVGENLTTSGFLPDTCTLPWGKDDTIGDDTTTTTTTIAPNPNVTCNKTLEDFKTWASANYGTDNVTFDQNSCIGTILNSQGGVATSWKWNGTDWE